MSIIIFMQYMIHSYLSLTLHWLECAVEFSLSTVVGQGGKAWKSSSLSSASFSVVSGGRVLSRTEMTCNRVHKVQTVYVYTHTHWHVAICSESLANSTSIPHLRHVSVSYCSNERIDLNINKYTKSFTIQLVYVATNVVGIHARMIHL